MPKLPRPTGAEMVRFLERQNFTMVGIRARQRVLECGVLRTVVPVHRGQTLKIGTLRGILRDIFLSQSGFADRFPR